MQHMLANNYFNWRQSVIVPNVSYGMNINYEIDLLVVSNSLYCHEIEIKVTKQDIKADFTKRIYHNANFVKLFSYAVPEDLKYCEYLPDDCGLIVVPNNIKRPYLLCPPKINKQAKKLTIEQYLKLIKLCNCRMWSLRNNNYAKLIVKLKQERKGC
jgi:hypothetical protein